MNHGRSVAAVASLLVGCGGPSESAPVNAPVVVAVNDAGASEPLPPKDKHNSLPPPAEDDRAVIRERMEKLAEERDRLDAQAAGSGGDPANGSFTMAEATAGLAGQGALVATIKTSLGDLRCKLFDDKAPLAVANFVGLARGLRPWKDPATGQWVKRPAYDNTSFHRVIAGFMIQGGDPKGDGTGEPGYVLPDELWGGKHDRPGLLCEANRGPNTNGMQFFVTDAKTPHLDSGYTIYGECSPTSVVSAIANVPKGPGDRPRTPVVIKTVDVTRAAAAKPTAKP